MPELHLLWIAHAGPEAAALVRHLGRILRRLLHPVVTPALALAIGAALPRVAHLALAALPEVVAALIFCAVVSAEPGRTSRAEAARTAWILYVCMFACPAAVAAAMAATGLGPTLTCAAMMVAGSPVSMGGGVVAERFGLPGRPVVWAAVMGIALVPVSLPLVAAASGAPGLPPPRTLAAASLVIAGLPLVAALGARRACPRRVAACRGGLRLLLVVSLTVLACAAGGRAIAALTESGGWRGCAVALGVQAAAAGVAWASGRSVAAFRRSPRSPTLAPQLALASSMRNTSLVWAACLAAGELTPTAEAVFSVFVATTFLAPVAAALGAAAKRRYSASAPEMISISSRVMLACRVRL